MTQDPCNNFTPEQSRRLALFAVRVSLDATLGTALESNRAMAVATYNQSFAQDALDAACATAIVSATAKGVVLRIEADIVQCTHQTSVNV